MAINLANNSPCSDDSGLSYEKQVSLEHRFKTLPKKDKEDFVKLFSLLDPDSTEEEQSAILAAIDEILWGKAEDMQRVAYNPSSSPESLAAWRDYVGREIKKLRLAAGLSQEQLASKAGIPQSHLSRLECGAHSPSFKTRSAIAAALGVDVKMLDPIA